MVQTQDIKFMQSALMLARRGLGQVWPNPSVGCILVRNGVVIGRGVTSSSGRPHAEMNAIRMAKGECKGATAYITLEPCSHFGKTPPCVDLIISSKIKRVVIATSDPDPRVNGQGIQKLREKGIEVITGICESEARAINSGFVHKVKEKLPLVSLKIASSADGKIATSIGESKWITSREARNFGHLIRSKHDCIITGIGTVIKDNPLLTCRLKGLENKSPVRVIIDTELKIPLKCKLVESARKVPLWVFAADDVVASVKNLAALQAKMNIRLFGVKRAASGVDITAVLKTLAAEGITRAMVEAGPILSSTFIKEKLVDNIYWFRSSSVIGGDASPAIRPLDILRLTDSLRFHRKCIRNLGQDILEEFTCSPE